MDPLETPPPAAPPGQAGADSGAPAERGQPDLHGLAEQVAARHVPPGYDPATGRRPRGRPRKDGRPAGSVVDPSPAPPLAGVEAPPDAPPGHLVDPDFIGDVVKAVCQGVEGWEKAEMYRQRFATLNDAKAAREIAERVGPPPGAIETLGRACVEMGRKYQWLGQWTPETVILGVLATWAGKDLLLFADGKKAPPPPAPAAN